MSQLWEAGAVQTMVRMLGSAPVRCAGITMLGKTVELCHDQVCPHVPV